MTRGPLLVVMEEGLFSEPKTIAKDTPPLSDKSPYAQGWNDWLAFGDAAKAIGKEWSQKWHGEYERGKREAKEAYYRKD